LDGIALSGILPAPLIIFSTFVGYFGNGWPGAILITIGIFIPAFAFTMIGHNLMEKLIEHKYLHNFLEGVTAGVIGIMAFTAFQLLRNTITDAFAVILFILCLLIIIKIKSKFTSAMVILGAGLVSFIFSRF
jgi:chromate transporter